MARRSPIFPQRLRGAEANQFWCAIQSCHSWAEGFGGAEMAECVEGGGAGFVAIEQWQNRRDAGAGFFIEAGEVITAEPSGVVIGGGADAGDERRNRIRSEVIDEFFDFDAHHDVRAGEPND